MPPGYGQIRYAAELSMRLDEILPIYAEVAIALAGFVGVVSAFAGRERQFRSTERTRFMYVVFCACSVLAGCLAYFTLGVGGLDRMYAAQAAAFAGFLVTVFGAAPVVPAALRAARESDSTTETWSLWVFIGGLAVESILFLAAILLQGDPLLLLSGFSLQLLLGLWMFIRLLSRPN